MTILLKRAWAGLVISTAMLISLIVLLQRMDSDVWCWDESMEFTTYAIYGTGWLLFGLAVLLTRPRGSQVVMDERDSAIQRKALVIQMWVTFGTTLAWVNTLTDMYIEDCAVPIKYLWFIFWSILVVNLVAHSIGIIVGYWRANRHE